MSKCYIVQRFVGTVAQRSWLLWEQDRAFVSISIRDEVATWVYERSMQSNSVTILWANITDIYRQNFANTIHWQHRHIGWYIGVLIHRSNCNRMTLVGIVLGSRILSFASMTVPHIHIWFLVCFCTICMLTLAHFGDIPPLVKCLKSWNYSQSIKIFSWHFC